MFFSFSGWCVGSGFCCLVDEHRQAARVKRARKSLSSGCPFSAAFLFPSLSLSSSDHLTASPRLINLRLCRKSKMATVDGATETMSAISQPTNNSQITSNYLGLHAIQFPYFFTTFAWIPLNSQTILTCSINSPPHSSSMFEPSINGCKNHYYDYFLPKPHRYKHFYYYHQPWLFMLATKQLISNFGRNRRNSNKDGSRDGGKQKNFNKNSFLLNFLYSDAAHPSMETGHARSRNLPTLYSRTGHPESIRLCGTFPKCSPCCLLSFAVTCGFHEKPNFGSKNEKFLGAMEAKNYICCSSEAD